MKILKKAAVALAATSMLVAPVAVSAAPLADLRVISAVEGENDVAGASWVLILLAVAAAIGAIVVIADGSDDEPTSP